MKASMSLKGSNAVCRVSRQAHYGSHQFHDIYEFISFPTFFVRKMRHKRNTSDSSLKEVVVVLT